MGTGGVVLESLGAEGFRLGLLLALEAFLGRLEEGPSLPS